MSANIQKVRYDSLTQTDQQKYTTCPECKKPFNANDYITQMPITLDENYNYIGGDYAHSDCFLGWQKANSKPKFAIFLLFVFAIVLKQTLPAK